MSLLAAILCLLAVCLSGCETGTPTREPVTIAFGCREFETEFYETLSQEFQQSHPGIAVDLRNVRALGADVFVASQFELPGLREEGAILSLDPFIERHESLDLPDFYPGMVDLLTSEGDTWAIPAGADATVMYYSKDLFDQNGTPYPDVGWTWADFLSAAIAINDPEAPVYGYALNLEAYESMIFVYQHGGRLFDDLEDPTRTTFDDPLTVEAVKWYAQLINEHHVAPAPEQARVTFGRSRTEFYRAVLTGKAGMWMGMLSEQREVLRIVKTDVGWGVVPLPRDARSVTGVTVDGYVISAEAEHIEECWQWIVFLSSHVPRNLIPARESVAESVIYEQRVGKELATVARLCMEGAALISPKLSGFEKALDAFQTGVEEVINRRSTAEEAMNWAQRQAEQQAW